MQKLVDFQTSLTTLEAAGKVDAATAEALIAEAQAAIDCINSLTTTTSTA